MNNIFMLTKSNLIKNKSQSLSIFIVMLLVSLFLNIGLVIYIDVVNFLHTRADELNSSHFSTVQRKDAPSNAQINFINDYPDIYSVESQSVIIGIGSVGNHFGGFIISYDSPNQFMNPMTPFEDVFPLYGDAIYLPRVLFLSSGYNLGDTITVVLMGEEFYFTLAGSTEEILYDGMMNLWRLYIPAERFAEIQSIFPEYNVNLISSRMEDSSQISTIYQEYRNIFFGTEYALTGELSRFGFYLPITYDELFEARSSIPMIFSAFTIALAIILLVVGIIVIRFQITNNIEENIVNIGILKAVGHSNFQIILSIVLQFVFVVIIAAILGALASSLLIPLLIQIIEPMFGLRWLPSVNFTIILFSIFVIILITFVFSFISSFKINSLDTLVILRGGLNSYQFRKNIVPFYKSKNPIVLQMALKRFFQNKKQGLMISLIVTSLTFAGSASIATHYNMSVNIDDFVQMAAGELAFINLIVNLNDSQLGADFYNRMSNNSEVSKIFGSEDIGIFIENNVIATTIIENFEYLQGYSLVYGRFPTANNEIVLTPLALSSIEKEVGDFISLRTSNESFEFLITGLITSSNHAGFSGMIDINSFLILEPDFVFRDFHIVLEDGVDEEVFVNFLYETEGNIFFNIVSIQNEIDTQIASMGSIFSLIAFIILIVSFLVIIMILYMIIKITILRLKRELGIQKAIGFTNFQLMNQIALNLTPSIVIGVLTGSVIGYLSFGTIFGILLSGLGGTGGSLEAPILWIVMMSIALIILSYIVSILISWRIRKISAYSLVTQ
ncbi:MAG: ABC transporter permease [Defluviitaleaceae bacterium]|nr:ABC transporter permease [Defluviitaleaceae bacterium]